MVNRYTVHLDVLAESPEDIWRRADDLAEHGGSHAYAVTTADDWAQFVKHPQDRP